MEGIVNQEYALYEFHFNKPVQRKQGRAGRGSVHEGGERVRSSSREKESKGSDTQVHEEKRNNNLQS